MDKHMLHIKALLALFVITIGLNIWNNRYNSDSERSTIKAEFGKLVPSEYNGKVYYISIPEGNKNED